ncbi:MAG: hypothetical protein ABIO76_00395 [Ginsengibacter sp.]
MSKSTISKKATGAAFFLAITAATALAFVFVIKEGQRIKRENELLAYEVW